MNLIFGIILGVSAVVMTFTSPETLLPAMTDGAEKAVKLSFTLIVIYSVWLGIFNLLERSGVTEKISKLISPIVRLLFGSVSEKAEKYLTLNVTANVLGLGSVATPMGIKAAETLDEEGNEYAKAMLFTIAATSLQLMPTTVISLRAALSSAAPYDIVAPTILSTLVSTVSGILLTKIFVKK